MAKKLKPNQYEVKLRVTEPPNEILKWLNKEYGWPGGDAPVAPELSDAHWTVHRSLYVDAIVTVHKDGSRTVEIKSNG